MWTDLGEYARSCIVIETSFRLAREDVLHALGKLSLNAGPPENIRSDNCPEFVARAARKRF